MKIHYLKNYCSLFYILIQVDWHFYCLLFSFNSFTDYIPQLCYHLVLSVSVHVLFPAGGCVLWFPGSEWISRQPGGASPHCAHCLFHATTPAIVQCAHAEVCAPPEGHLVPQPQPEPQWNQQTRTCTWAGRWRIAARHRCGEELFQSEGFQRRVQPISSALWLQRARLWPRLRHGATGGRGWRGSQPH